MVDRSPAVSKLILSVDDPGTPVKKHCHIGFFEKTQLHSVYKIGSLKCKTQIS